MTLNDVQRAALALFAAREAGEGGSLEQMKAIAYIVRNRVKAGWFDGQWLTVIEHSWESAGNLAKKRALLDPSNRIFQRFVADIDDIYYGAGRPTRVIHETPTAQRFAADGGELEAATSSALFWAWLDRPYTPWFNENILGQSRSHPMRAQMGLLAFFD
jgi:hypothetical protein